MPFSSPPVFFLPTSTIFRVYCVSTTGCTYAAVERVNRDEVKPLIEDLVKTPFFRYFKVPGARVVPLAAVWLQ